MNKKFKKGIMAAVIASLLCTSLVACENQKPVETGTTENSETKDTIGSGELAALIETQASMLLPYFETVDSVENASLPYYYTLSEGDMTPVQDGELELFFINGDRQIPYIEMGTAVEIINNFNHLDKNLEDYEMEIGWDDTEIILSRENGSYAIILPKENKIYFPDIDLFFASPNSVSGLDISTVKSQPAKSDSASLTGEGTENEGFNLISRSKVSYVTGNMMTYDLGSYFIQFVKKDDSWLIPLQTISDVFTSHFYFNMLYNGKVVIACPYSGTLNPTTAQPTKTGELFSDAEEQLKGEALKQFTYNELCMILDYTYGLAEEHNIDSFDDYFIRSGLVYQLMSDNPADTYAALSTLTSVLFADIHSAVIRKSPYAKIDTSTDTLTETLVNMSSLENTDMGKYIIALSTYAQLRNRAMPDGAPGYQEVGNTAYITFDGFKYETNRDYYNTEITNNPNDTIELICYANEQLHREGCPIENVVLDLSCNTGGAADAALCVVAWFLEHGNTAFQDAKSKAVGITSYKFDANLDKKIDANDFISNFKLYCIISPVSFSCGNLVPSCFKGSDKVTLIGRTTGGGACIIRPLSTADGVIFNVSDYLVVSYSKNGSVYGADQGITPDIYIDDFSNVYDRQQFTDYINNLK